MTWTANFTGHLSGDNGAQEQAVVDKFREFVNGLGPETGLLSATFSGQYVGSQDLRVSQVANKAPADIDREGVE